MKKILKNIGYIVMCIVLLAMTVALAQANEEMYENFDGESELPTSQEAEETSSVEVASMTSTPTGNVSIETNGMAAVVEKYNESAVINCTWADIELTQSELELLYTTVYCEAGNQPLEAQIMVAQTIINRIASDNFPNTLRGVVYQRNNDGKPQFAVINWTDFENRGWTEECVAAVHYALAYRAYPDSMLYFRDSYYHDFGQPYKNVGDMYFSLEEVE